MRQSYYWILKALDGAGQLWAIQRLVLGIEACQGKCGGGDDAGAV